MDLNSFDPKSFDFIKYISWSCIIGNCKGKIIFQALQHKTSFENRVNKYLTVN